MSGNCLSIAERYEYVNLTVNNSVDRATRHGKPSSTRIYHALKDHIVPGSVLVHDGENAHNLLIEKLHLHSESYIANEKDKNYLENMALINNMCSWLKRYIYHFIGMRMDNLQSYLNWFVYLFRGQIVKLSAPSP